MVNSKKSTQNPRRASHLAEAVNYKLKALLAFNLSPVLSANHKVLLAFSGGLDSRVLLELLADLRTSIGFGLNAMHVHHGISPHADDWAKFCGDTCAALSVPIEVAHVGVERNSGLGLEAAARNARYQALLNSDADYVLLAHHQDDQAETLLLQLLRGAGVKGLSSMASKNEERRLLRPLLDISRADLEVFARHQHLEWIKDESNDDVIHDRNYCRHEVFPVIEKRFPAVKETFARSASHLGEAALLLDELAQMDSGQANQAACSNQLDLGKLASLSESRARNLLRWWLSVNKQLMPSNARLQEMLRQLLTAKGDAHVKIAVNSAEDIYLRRYQGLAYLESGSASQPIALLWQGEATLNLPDNSHLIFEKKMGYGLAFKRLGINKLRVSHRVGGERFKPCLTKPTRTLKHLLQEANIPPWQRERLPLIYSDDMLAVVPGIGVECTLQAREDEIGLVVLWEQA